MDISKILLRLQQIYTQLKGNNLLQAKTIFLELKIVDTPAHLSMPKKLRHLIWCLYEYLVLENESYINLEDVLSEFESVFANTDR